MSRITDLARQFWGVVQPIPDHDRPRYSERDMIEAERAVHEMYSTDCAQGQDDLFQGLITGYQEDPAALIVRPIRDYEEQNFEGPQQEEQGHEHQTR